jgi:hypothetical protein
MHSNLHVKNYGYLEQLYNMVCELLYDTPIRRKRQTSKIHMLCILDTIKRCREIYVLADELVFILCLNRVQCFSSVSWAERKSSKNESRTIYLGP